MSPESTWLSPILRLPPEIRLKIYRLLLLSDRTVRMTWLHDSLAQPNLLSPAILATCRIIQNEAMGVLYGENVFRAHRIDDTNNNAASITRAKFVIGIGGPENGGNDASRLEDFLNRHRNLKDLVLEFGVGLLEDGELVDIVSDAIVGSAYSSGLTVTVRSACRSQRACHNAERLTQWVDVVATLQKGPEVYRKVQDIWAKARARQLSCSHQVREV